MASLVQVLLAFLSMMQSPKNLPIGLGSCLSPESSGVFCGGVIFGCCWWIFWFGVFAFLLVVFAGSVVRWCFCVLLLLFFFLLFFFFFLLLLLVVVVVVIYLWFFCGACMKGWTTSNFLPWFCRTDGGYGSNISTWPVKLLVLSENTKANAQLCLFKKHSMTPWHLLVFVLASCSCRFWWNMVFVKGSSEATPC